MRNISISGNQSHFIGSGVFSPSLCLIFIRWQHRELLEYLQDSIDALAAKAEIALSGIPPMKWEDFLKELDENGSASG